MMVNGGKSWLISNVKQVGGNEEEAVNDAAGISPVFN